MTAGDEPVGRLLHALDERLRPTARASWVADDGSRAASGAPLAPDVAELLPGLARLLRREAGLFDGPGGRVTFEVGERTLLVQLLGVDGMVVIDARAGLNLALVRRQVEAVVAEHVPGSPADAPPPPLPRLPVRRLGPTAAAGLAEASAPAPGGALARRTLVPRQRADVEEDAAGHVRRGATDGSALGRVLAALLSHDA